MVINPLIPRLLLFPIGIIIGQLLCRHLFMPNDTERIEMIVSFVDNLPVGDKFFYYKVNTDGTKTLGSISNKCVRIDDLTASPAARIETKYNGCKVVYIPKGSINREYKLN